MSKLKVTQVRSKAGANPKQRATLAALGLRKMHQVVTHEDRPSVRGQINVVSHMVTVEEVD